MSARGGIGLVLGGGGARGLAHVGVLEALEAQGVRPDVLVGVSMGAVVGATYALREDWSRVLREEDWRRLPVVSETRDGDALERLSSYARSARRLAPTVTHWSWRRGFVDDARATLQDLIGEGPNFADCRVPFAAVATDLRAGTRRVLTEGSLLDAVLASASIPGLAAPTEWDGAALADGGFADPAPVDVARALGADRVLGVHVGLPSHEGQVEGGVGALLAAFEIGQRSFANTRFRHADLVLRPGFGQRIRMLEFAAVQAVIDAGARAVEDRRAEIAELVARGVRG
ncbi:patatin-like phospholipase family protein [Egibacter rhizosphaerae]|nr:patatin-like phospholipase family protein [Egibacter rhizosphaerae]